MPSFARLIPFAFMVLASLATGASAQRSAAYADLAGTRVALEKAQADGQAARQRAERLEASAARASQAAEKTAREAAALAARIQQSEAGIVAAEARLALIERQKAALRARLARKQKPLVKLTAALQKFARRPLVFAVLRPGTTRDVVYMRAMLASALPQVERRTAALRAEIARGQALEREAGQALASFRASESELEARRKELAALETRQRLASRQASGSAAREAERALALAEEARDLDGLIARLDAAGSLREQLAALSGPIIRPPRPTESEVVTPAPAVAAGAGSPPAGYQLPVAGRIVAGFGAVSADGARSQGVTLVPPGAAQVVSPAAGRVVFAGPYRGYGQIVIVEHAGGWTSLVTGLKRIDVAVGDRLLGGSPLGIAAPDRSSVTLELRRKGEPVNPLEYLA